MSKPFKPMKAVNDEMSFDDIVYPALISVKIDGVYGLNIGGDLLGRSLKSMKNKWLNEKLGKDVFSGFVGEVVNAKISFDESEPERLNRQDLCRNTTSHTGSISKEDWSMSWVLFDYIKDGSFEYCQKPYVDRMTDLIENLDQVVEGIDDGSCKALNIAGIEYFEFDIDGVSLLIASGHEVNSAEEAEEIYNLALDQGHEGVILRSVDGVYKFGRATKKSQEIVRFKPSGDSEIIVTSVEPMFENNNEAKVNELGYTERSSHKENKVQLEMVGALVGFDVNTKEEVRISAGKMTHEERSTVWIGRGDYIGRLAKYRSMLTGVKDKPRHARFIGWRNIEDLDETVVDTAKELRIYIKE